MTFHQILRQKKIANGRQNGREQNANGLFALIEEIAYQAECEGGVPSCQRVSEFENHRRPRNRDQCPYLFDRDRTLRRIERQLFQLVGNHARVSAGGKDEKLQGFVLKFQAAFLCCGADNLTGVFFPTAPVQIRLIENLNLRQFGQRLVKRSTLVWIDRANEKCDVVWKSGGKKITEFFQRLENIGRFSSHVVGEQIRTLEPD